jgi:hypothetical protein
MIGAKDDADAINEANRSLLYDGKATIENLERWNGTAYEPALISAGGDPLLDA